MDIKERIKELCKKNGISMNALEKELGLGIGYISKLGKSTPNAKYLQKIAERFGVTTDYIMNGKENKPNLQLAELEMKIIKDDELMKRLRKYMDLPQEKKDLILAMIDNL